MLKRTSLWSVCLWQVRSRYSSKHTLDAKEYYFVYCFIVFEGFFLIQTGRDLPLSDKRKAPRHEQLKYQCDSSYIQPFIKLPLLTDTDNRAIITFLVSLSLGCCHLVHFQSIVAMTLLRQGRHPPLIVKREWHSINFFKCHAVICVTHFLYETLPRLG